MIFPESVNLQISLTDLCNVDCICCTLRPGNQPFHGDKKRGFMDEGLFARILESAGKSCKSLAIQLQWFGEPLLYPNMPFILETVGKNPVKSLAILTNGILLDQRVRNSVFRLIEEKDPTGQKFQIFFHISVDAMTEKTYKTVKRSNRLSIVMNNILAILEQRKKNNLIWPRLFIQFIMMQENHHESEAFRDFWLEKLGTYDRPPKIIFHENGLDYDGDIIFFKQLDTVVDSKTPDCGVNLFMEKVPIISKELANLPPVSESTETRKTMANIPTIQQKTFPLRRACRFLWHNLTVHHSGAVTACCADLHFKLLNLDFNKAGFEEIFASPQLIGLRKSHILGQKPPFCESCAFVEFFQDPDLAWLVHTAGKRREFDNIPLPSIDDLFPDNSFFIHIARYLRLSDQVEEAAQLYANIILEKHNLGKITKSGDIILDLGKLERINKNQDMVLEMGKLDKGKMDNSSILRELYYFNSHRNHESYRNHEKRPLDFHIDFPSLLADSQGESVICDLLFAGFEAAITGNKEELIIFFGEIIIQYFSREIGDGLPKNGENKNYSSSIAPLEKFQKKKEKPGIISLWNLDKTVAIGEKLISLYAEKSLYPRALEILDLFGEKIPLKLAVVCFSATGNFEKAISLRQKILVKEPENISNIRAYALDLKGANMLEQALEKISLCIQLIREKRLDEEINSGQLSQDRLAQAWLFKDTGDKEKARALFLDLARDPFVSKDALLALENMKIS